MVKVANPARKTNSKLFAFPRIIFLHAFKAVQHFEYHLTIAGATNVERRLLEMKMLKEDHDLAVAVVKIVEKGMCSAF